MLFEVIIGQHTHYGVVYGKGDIVEDDEDIRLKWKNKFRRVDAPDPPSKKRKKRKKGKGRSKPTITAKRPAKTAKDATAATARGKNVTSDFETAPEGLQVFQRGIKYHVYEGGETKAVNKKGLAKDDVEAFITDYMEN